MKKIIFTLIITTSTIMFSQVGIGTTNPSSKSILDLTATDKGLLLPRMTSNQRNSITPSAVIDKGLHVFDTTTNTVWYWNGSIWVEQGAKNIYDSNGDVSPSSATNRTVNFSNGGTLNFDSNTMVIDASSNRVGIGLINPVSKFSNTNNQIVGTSYGTSSNGIQWAINDGGFAAAINNQANNGGGLLVKTTGTSAEHHAFQVNTGAGSGAGILVRNDGNIGIGNTNPTQRLEITSGTTNLSGLKFTNINASTPISSGAQALGVDANGLVVTVPNATPTTVTRNGFSTQIGISGNQFAVTDGNVWTTIPGTSTNITVPDGGKATFFNFMIGIDLNTPAAPNSGFAYYTVAIFIDGIVSEIFLTSQEPGPSGLQLSYTLSGVKFLAGGNHTVEARMSRTTNNGTTTGSFQFCSPISLSFNASFIN